MLVSLKTKRIFVLTKQITMTANKISLRELSNMMYQVFDKVSLDMAYYQAMFNGLITDMNFRFVDLNALDSEMLLDVEDYFDSSTEEAFYDKINFVGITEEKFYNICCLFIEPIFIPKSLTA